MGNSLINSDCEVIHRHCVFVAVVVGIGRVFYPTEPPVLRDDEPLGSEIEKALFSFDELPATIQDIAKLGIECKF